MKWFFRVLNLSYRFKSVNSQAYPRKHSPSKHRNHFCLPAYYKQALLDKVTLFRALLRQPEHRKFFLTSQGYLIGYGTSVIKSYIGGIRDKNSNKWKTVFSSILQDI